MLRRSVRFGIAGAIAAVRVGVGVGVAAAGGGNTATSMRNGGPSAKAGGPLL
jgi:hypothetical protein